MGIIEFPNSREQLVQLGQAALAKENLLEAVQLFYKAYELQPEFSLNLLMVNLQIELGENQQAYELAQDYLDIYQQEPNAFAVYFQLLLLNRQFLAARKQLQTFADAAYFSDSLELWHQQLADAEEYAEKFEKQKISRLLEQLAGAADLPAEGQFQLIKEMQQLPLRKYLEVSRQWLQEPRISYFSRLRIIETLAETTVSQAFETLWFDGQSKQFVPKELPLPQEEPIYLGVVKGLENALEQEDPSLLAALKEEVRLHFAVLYPFAADYYSDPQLTAQCYLAAYQEEAWQEDQDLLAQELLTKRQALSNFCLSLS